MYCTTIKFTSGRKYQEALEELWEWRSEKGKLMDWSKAALALSIEN